MYTVPELNTWISGDCLPSRVELPDVIRDPNDDNPIQRGRASSPAQVEHAVAAAERVHRERSWQDLGVIGRGEYLETFATRLEAVSEQIAVLDAVNSGVPLAMTTLFARSLADTVRGARKLALDRGDAVELAAGSRTVRLRHLPWGPTALIIPWNAPSALMTKKMAYALAAGAPVIVKPSPAAPWSAQLIAAAAAQVFPPGVVSMLLGGADVGAALCGDRRVKAVSMTGSTATGQAIAALAAANLTKLRLELGSNNPVVVRADADIPATADALYRGMTKLNGQWCEAPRVVFAVGESYDGLLDALAGPVRDARLGASLDRRTEVGPQAFAARRTELEGQRAALVAGGRQLVAQAAAPERGAFVGPTLLRGAGADLPGEVFGPMLTVEPVDSDAEALRRANAVGGGLAGYVFGTDVEAAMTVGGQLIAGEVKINGTSLLDMADESAQSFFGLSGLGGHGDRDVLAFYSGKQVLGEDLAEAAL
ncbi:aldehyde dehydrogenase family protein [Mycolicibacterium sp.]|uniref:aldehyde dehydrogenase family protein n=1 Tax=Mycolicibacterium sp. TaxID=2320850 RepID=UPI003D0B3B74